MQVLKFVFYRIIALNFLLKMYTSFTTFQPWLSQIIQKGYKMKEVLVDGQCLNSSILLALQNPGPSYNDPHIRVEVINFWNNLVLNGIV